MIKNSNERKHFVKGRTHDQLIQNVMITVYCLLVPFPSILTHRILHENYSNALNCKDFSDKWCAGTGMLKFIIKNFLPQSRIMQIIRQKLLKFKKLLGKYSLQFFTYKTHNFIEIWHTYICELLSLIWLNLQTLWAVQLRDRNTHIGSK